MVAITKLNQANDKLTQTLSNQADLSDIKTGLIQQANDLITLSENIKSLQDTAVNSLQSVLAQLKQIATMTTDQAERLGESMQTTSQQANNLNKDMATLEQSVQQTQAQIQSQIVQIQETLASCTTTLEQSVQQTVEQISEQAPKQIADKVIIHLSQQISEQASYYTADTVQPMLQEHTQALDQSLKRVRNIANQTDYRQQLFTQFFIMFLMVIIAQTITLLWILGSLVWALTALELRHVIAPALLMLAVVMVFMLWIYAHKESYGLTFLGNNGD